MASKKLFDIPFFDLYLEMSEGGKLEYTLGGVGDSGGGNYATGVNSHEPDAEFIESLSEEQMHECMTLFDLCQKTHAEKLDCDSFAIRFAERLCRVSVMHAYSGKVVFVVRRAPREAPDIEKLGIPPWIQTELLAKGLKGLVLICGASGSGKTWTASATLVKRIMVYGGVAATIEDPPELPLEGRYSHPGREGVIYQTEVVTGGFSESLRRALRWGRDITLFVGEIRDGHTALEVLRASLNGHLVFATVHGQDIPATISRFEAMASAANNNESKSTRDMIGAGLAAVIHLELEKTLGADFRTLPKYKALFVTHDIRGAFQAAIQDLRATDISRMQHEQTNRMVTADARNRRTGN